MLFAAFLTGAFFGSGGVESMRRRTSFSFGPRSSFSLARRALVFFAAFTSALTLDWAIWFSYVKA